MDMRKLENERILKVIQYLFFPISIFYLEMVLIFYCYGSFLSWGTLYILLFSFTIGGICLILSSVWNGRTNRVVAILLMLIITLIFSAQAVYFTIFKTFTSMFSATKAGEVISEFWDQALLGIGRTAIPLLFLFVPLILLIVFRRKVVAEKRPTVKTLVSVFLLAAAMQFAGMASIRMNTAGVMSYKYVYYDSFAIDLSVPRFGMLTTMRLDLIHVLSLENEQMIDILPDDDGQNEEKPPEAGEDKNVLAEVAYGENVMDIDFDELIANETDKNVLEMHEYFKNVTPTTKNLYTGMFEGYNLIWIVAEGFSSLALDETHTPTLCKLANEGFVFNNFYNPIWGVSTSDGEYVATTGLIPKSGVWSYSRSSSNYMPFGFGNIFGKLGYECLAYHNHTYTYYDRDKSYPNMGYAYKGVGNGLDVKIQWPNSDVEMMEKTVPEFITQDKFLVYYMTVSGHLNYNFSGNNMCAKHKADVADLPYSEPARAYIACQMEFDQSIKYLIDQLDAAGVLEKTVIVISGDHYPYGLEVSQMEELAGHELDETFELYRSSLMIWNSEMETVSVDKYCSSLDIMPTLANLFGVEYDSRLVMGRDILSDTKPLVIFNDRSYITDMGRYNSSTDTFTPNEGMGVSDTYAPYMLDIISDRFKYSAMILENDYYAKVFKQE